jgi:DNA/RNA-binding domain of Phe-tRNA-synthetase-like protein
MFFVSEKWTQTYPAAAVGVLTMQGVTNPQGHPELGRHKAALEEALRARYGAYERADLKALPVMAAYVEYYSRFKKTYHILLQLESIVFQGKGIPRVAGLVEAMFMAELEDHLLTAGHDLAVVEPPVRIDVAQGDESYERLNGRAQTLKAGDIYIADAQGVLSSIIYGPDRRTRIRPETEQVLFTAYAPPGIGAPAVNHHLENIRDKVRIVAPGAEVTVLDVYEGGGT